MEKAMCCPNVWGKKWNFVQIYKSLTCLHMWLTGHFSGAFVQMSKT